MCSGAIRAMVVRLLPDAEAGEDLGEDVLGDDLAGQLFQGLQGGAEVHGRQLGDVGDLLGRGQQVGRARGGVGGGLDGPPLAVVQEQPGGLDVQSLRLVVRCDCRACSSPGSGRAGSSAAGSALTSPVACLLHASPGVPSAAWL